MQPGMGSGLAQHRHVLTCSPGTIQITALCETDAQRRVGHVQGVPYGMQRRYWLFVANPLQSEPVLSGEETPLSRHELFDAYIAREINRRTFVQGLMALGVLWSRRHYAVAQPAAARGSTDPCLPYLYGPPELYELYCTDPGDDRPPLLPAPRATSAGSTAERRARRSTTRWRPVGN